MNDIFVSYARVDNEPMPGVRNGWVTELTRGLKNRLAAHMGRKEKFKLWMDNALRGNQTITPEIMRQLNQSKTLLLILSKGYQESEWCQKELAAFLTRFSADSRRIFVVEPDEFLDPPAAIADLKKYRFWQKTPEDKITRLAFPQPEPKQHLYYQKIDDLALDIVKVITAEAPSPEDPSVTPSLPDPQHTVFLAEVSADLHTQWEELQRFFADHDNIRVLPAGPYPPPLKQEEAIANDLKQADLFIQLLNENGNNGWSEYYFNCAQENICSIIQWHPPSLDLKKVSDESHQKLLTSEYILSDDLTELQKEITRRLDPPVKKDSPQDTFLFLHHAPEDEDFTQSLMDHLDQKGYPYIASPTLENTGSVTKQRQELEENLLGCDAMIFLYYKASQSWLQAQFRSYHKIRHRRDQEIKGVGICRKPNAPVGAGLPNLQVICCPDQDAATCIDRFFAGLAS